MMALYAERALAEFLFQVNKIEKGGFDTYAKTLDAIRKGALMSCSPSSHTDSKLESVRCLYRALRHWFNPDVRLSVTELEESHQLLLGSTKPDIVGHIRSLDHEAVWVKTEDEPGCHLFMWPTEVRSALHRLLERAKSELARITEEADKGQISSKSRIEHLLKLGGSFFLAFENIHPFLDGNGRCGRILLAYLLQSVLLFPNVLFVGSPDIGPDLPPPFVDPIFFYDCFQCVQSQQQFELQEDGRSIFTKESRACSLDFPRDLTALIIEGVYVGWKRFFDTVDTLEPQRTMGTPI
ncbi:hypothetical protein L7F22_068990 [Adiantum nelumboides]|nr:hypothetical protein [Adiantum nelumboides]